MRQGGKLSLPKNSRGRVIKDDIEILRRVMQRLAKEGEARAVFTREILQRLSGDGLAFTSAANSFLRREARIFATMNALLDHLESGIQALPSSLANRLPQRDEVELLACFIFHGLEAAWGNSFLPQERAALSRLACHLQKMARPARPSFMEKLAWWR
jgi:hypothetical protein